MILASASPRRRILLKQLGIPFDVWPADVDETVLPNELPEAAAERLARIKALAVPADDLVIAADTVVAIDGVILGKPLDDKEARRMLRVLRGRWHAVSTGVAVRFPMGNVRSGIATTAVRMRSYTDDEIERYLATGDPYDKAGAYAIQHEEFHPVAEINGDYDTVVGLPLALVRLLLNSS